MGPVPCSTPWRRAPSGADPIRLGAKVPNSGALPARFGVARMAAELEAAGFDSLWVGDHLLTAAAPETRYPYSGGGRMISDPIEPWYDSIVTMSVIAAATSRCEVGVGVLVLPLRHPVVAAKQIASLDVLSGGRVVLGVGAGWMRKEFDALGVDFGSRGRQLEAGVAVLRECWSGRLGDMVALPAPGRPLPVLVGGMSPVALRRAGTIGDGWYAVQPLAGLDPDEMARGVTAMEKAAAGASRPSRVALRITGSASGLDTVAGALGDLDAAGVTEVVVDVPLGDPAAASEALRTLRAAARPH